MNPITAIIIDDETHCRETLEWEIRENCSQVTVLEKCASAFEGMHAIRKLKPDVVFLDIEMPKMNGFEMLQEMGPMNTKVIFTTAYDQFAIKAFRVSALDYLVKPIDGEELKQAVDKVLPKGGADLHNEQLELLLEKIQSPHQISRIAFPTQEGLEIVPSDLILHAESQNNYTYLYFSDGRKLVVSKTLKEVEELMPEPGFLRVHHSHIVNLQHVRKYIRGDGGYLVLIDDSHINVSRSRKEDLLNALKGRS